MIDVALRRQQSSAGKSLDHVVFRLLLPLPLSLQRRSILRRRAFIFHTIDADVRQLVGFVILLQVVSPYAGLRLECILVFHPSAEVAFFAVDVGGNPVSRNQIQAPAIHMEEERIPRRRSIRSVQAHNVVILILDPDPAQESSLAGILLRSDVEHEAAHIAEKFAANVVELVVIAVKVGAVGVDHPRETERLVLHLEELVEAPHQPRLHALLFFFQVIFTINRLTHIHAAKKVMIFAGHGTELGIKAKILQVSLDHRRARGERLHQSMLALDEAVDNLIHRARLRQSRWRRRWSRALLPSPRLNLSCLALRRRRLRLCGRSSLRGIGGRRGGRQLRNGTHAQMLRIRWQRPVRGRGQRLGLRGLLCGGGYRRQQCGCEHPFASAHDRSLRLSFDLKSLDLCCALPLL